MRVRPRVALFAAAVALAGAAALVAPTTAGAAAGVLIWTGAGGDTPVPFPADDECFATPGATGAQNFTSADAFFFVDDSCTIGKEAGNTGPLSTKELAFESFRVRSSAN